MNSKLINIVTMENIVTYTLRLSLDDGVRQDVDSGPCLTNARHPDIRAILEEPRFNMYRLEHGERVWGDDELSFRILDRYRNSLDKQTALEGAA